MIRELASEVPEENYDALDKGALTNGAIAEKKKGILQNKIRWASNFFSYVGEGKIQSIADLAMEKNFPTRAFVRAMEKMVDDYDKFPSFKVISELVRSHSGTQHTYDNTKDQERNKELAEFLEAKELFLKKVPEGKYEAYVKWWVKNTFPKLDKDMMSAFGINYMIFERCAVFDWKDTSEHGSFNEILVTAERKKIKMKELRAKGKTPEARLR